MDAFSLAWADLRAYCFPSFSLLLRALQKLQGDEAGRILDVVLWTTQVWFPKLLCMLTDFPVLLPSRTDLCHTLTGQHHPLLKIMKLMMCALPWKCWKSRAFQETLPELVCLPGEIAQNDAMIHASKDGSSIALIGWKIPLVPLQMNWLFSSVDYKEGKGCSTLNIACSAVYAVFKWRLFSGQPCSCPKMFNGCV